MVRTILGIASLLLMWTLCGPLNAQAKGPTAPKGVLKQPIVGLGQTEEAAKKDAVQRAAEAVAVVMKQCDPPVRHFKADADFVKDHVLASAGKAAEDIKLEEFPAPVKQWVVTLRPYADWWQDLLRRDHIEEIKLRAEER